MSQKYRAGQRDPAARVEYGSGSATVIGGYGERGRFQMAAIPEPTPDDRAWAQEVVGSYCEDIGDESPAAMLGLSWRTREQAVTRLRELGVEVA